MAEYIDRKKLLEWHKSTREIESRNGYLNCGADEFKILMYCIKKAPAADVAQVVHGQWQHNEKPDCEVCSVCNIYSVIKYKFCPNCGARMDLEE